MDIQYIVYNENEFTQEKKQRVDGFLKIDNKHVNWLDISSWEDDKDIIKIGKELGLHSLVIEDILDESQRPKTEDYGEYIFLITKVMNFPEDEEIDELESRNIYFILYKDRLISFRKKGSDIFKNPIKRIEEGSVIRNHGSDELLYVLVDSILEEYFELTEELGEKIDDIEDILLINPSREVLNQIYILKRDLIYIRKSLWSMRNAVSTLSRNDNLIIDDKTMYYIRSLYDDIIQMIDLVETYREICSGMLDTYLSSIGNKTNDVMKILTIFSTIFIPITCIAGIYGMNFKHMPILDMRYGYLAFWVISIGITLYMLRYFKKKDWF